MGRTAINRRYYLKNKTLFRELAKKHTQMLIQYVLDYKLAHPCPCGEDAPECLVFHHRDPVAKVTEIARAIGSRWSISRLRSEIEKCDVLCANCHLKLHHRRKQQ